MRTMPYVKDRKYDEGLEMLLKLVTKGLNTNDDDFLLPIIGTRGTGKSRLMLHILEAYLGDEASVDYLGLNRGDFTNALYKAKNKPMPRFCGNDEANISKREALTKFNRDMIDLYFSIRGLNIFHVWCNPSIDMLDKAFIEEMIKGLIFVFTKNTDGHPRLYFYFTQAQLLKIFEKYKNLKLKTIKKVAKEYAYFRGWFYDYDGKLLKDYLNKKEFRMDDKIDEFKLKYGKKEDMLKRPEFLRRLGISREAWDKTWEKKLLDNKIINPEEIEITALNRKLYPTRYVQTVKEFMQNETKT